MPAEARVSRSSTAGSPTSCMSACVQPPSGRQRPRGRPSSARRGSDPRPFPGAPNTGTRDPRTTPRCPGSCRAANAAPARPKRDRPRAGRRPTGAPGCRRRRSSSNRPARNRPGSRPSPAGRRERRPPSSPGVSPAAAGCVLAVADPLEPVPQRETLAQPLVHHRGHAHLVVIRGKLAADLTVRRAHLARHQGSPAVADSPSP